MNSYDINLEKVPTHIAIIMDGNGRWAKSRFLPRTAGHKAGVEAIREVIKESQRLGVKHLTLYAFSTENWKRPKLEVDTLMTLLATYLSKEIKELHANNVKVTTIGDISKLPKNCIEQLNNAFELTKDNTGVNLNLALNYGSRDDIKNAIIDGLISYTKLCTPLFSTISGASRKAPNWAFTQKQISMITRYILPADPLLTPPKARIKR